MCSYAAPFTRVLQQSDLTLHRKHVQELKTDDTCSQLPFPQQILCMTLADLTQKLCCLALCTCETEETAFLPCLPSPVSEDFSQGTRESRYLPQWRSLHSIHSHEYSLNSRQGQIRRQIHQRWLLSPWETPILLFLGITLAVRYLLYAAWRLTLQLPHRKWSLYDVWPCLTAGEEASRLASAITDLKSCWDVVATHTQTSGLRHEGGPAGRLSQRGKTKRMGESEAAFEGGGISLYVCWESFSIISYCAEGNHENAGGQEAQPFLWDALCYCG